VHAWKTRIIYQQHRAEAYECVQVLLGSLDREQKLGANSKMCNYSVLQLFMQKLLLLAAVIDPL
jgi:hypothetical protein